MGPRRGRSILVPVVVLFAIVLAPRLAGADADWRTWERYMDTGQGALNQNRVVSAESWFAMAVREAERLDARDPRLGESLRKLLEIYRKVGRDDDAKTIEARLATLAPPATTPSDLVDALRGFAALLMQSGRPLEAREVERASEEVLQRQDAGKRNQPDVLVYNPVFYLRTYSAMLRTQNRSAEATRIDALTAVVARELAQRFVRRRRGMARQTALPSLTHMQLLDGANEASAARLFPEAEAFAIDAVKIAETFPGGEVTLAYSVSVLAATQAAQGKRAAFDEALQRAMPALERAGLNHGLVLPALRVLAIAHLEHAFDPAKTQVHLRRSLQVIQRDVAPDHPTVGLHLAGLAAAALALEGPERAKADLDRALGIAEKLYTREDVYLARAFTRFVTVAVERRDYALAHSVASRVVGMLKRMLDPGHPEVVLANDRVRAISEQSKPVAK